MAIGKPNKDILSLFLSKHGNKKSKTIYYDNMYGQVLEQVYVRKLEVGRLETFLRNTIFKKRGIPHEIKTQICDAWHRIRK